MTQIEVLDTADVSENPAKRIGGRHLALTTGGAPLPKKFRLKTVQQVADELARVYRGMRDGSIRPEDGSRYAYTLRTLGELRAVATFEARIETLEQVGKGEQR